MMKDNIYVSILKSWACVDNPYYSTQDILEWLKEKEKDVRVSIHKRPYEYDGFWHYSKEALGITNDSHSYFDIKGIHFENDEGTYEQPIIIQDGIGYLGIITKVIDGMLYFLMQAKVEPGNINKYQISPTIQATKSNFTRAHGGKTPLFFEYFKNKENYQIIADQIQSEQSSRFLGKRNRNIIILVEDDIEVPETHRWLTLGQIKQLMRYDNIINMDTRSVISCIPFALRNYTAKELEEVKPLFTKEAFYHSMFSDESGESVMKMYQYMNDFKMHHTYKREFKDLNHLEGWTFQDGEYQSENGSFKIVYCDIKTEDREVHAWSQPLLEAVGKSEFGLICCTNENQVMEFLVQAKSEVGCFDVIEIAPSIQKEPNRMQITNVVDELFFSHLKANTNIEFRGLFSEEGGRFYHEENWNTIMHIDKKELKDLPEGYFWVDFHTLNTLIQFNNCLNIQLRNLISILDI